jgi:hypothetical protein
LAGVAEWQTQSIQNRSPKRHGGSTPSTGTTLSEGRRFRRFARSRVRFAKTLFALPGSGSFRQNAHGFVCFKRAQARGVEGADRGLAA